MMDNAAQYGLIGYPLGHSFSAAYFADKFSRECIEGISYECFPLRTIAELPALIAARPRLRGFNVTIPYKEQVIAFLDRLDPAAAVIGAVNCVVVGESGTLTGYNTDAPAFRSEVLRLAGGEIPRQAGGEMLHPVDDETPLTTGEDGQQQSDSERISTTCDEMRRQAGGEIPRLAGGEIPLPGDGEMWRKAGGGRLRAVILGTGGAAKAVGYALRTLGIDYITVSRTPERGTLTYGDLTRGIVAAHRLIINATPLGMYPDTDGCPPIPYDAITRHHYLYDLTYNPLQTEFMRRGERCGAKTANGYGMFAAQAELSWEIWREAQANL